jgi:hypothetical protein
MLNKSQSVISSLYINATPITSFPTMLLFHPIDRKSCRAKAYGGDYSSPDTLQDGQIQPGSQVSQVY